MSLLWGTKKERKSRTGADKTQSDECGRSPFMCDVLWNWIPSIMGSAMTPVALCSALRIQHVTYLSCYVSQS